MSILSGIASMIIGAGSEIVAPGNPMGIGMLASGLGTVIEGNPKKRNSGVAERSSIKPWNVVYGERRVGGTLVYYNTWGYNYGNTGGCMLDLIFVVAAHPCQAITGVYVDNQRVLLDTRIVPSRYLSAFYGPIPLPGSGTSIDTGQQNSSVNLIGISRDANGVVTVQTTLKPLPGSSEPNVDFSGLLSGDPISIIDVEQHANSGYVELARELDGSYTVAQVLNINASSSGVVIDVANYNGAAEVYTLECPANSITFTYLAGGAAVAFPSSSGPQTTGSGVASGQIATNYRNFGVGNLYFEWLNGSQMAPSQLGGSTGGSTFVGMDYGTPQTWFQGNGTGIWGTMTFGLIGSGPDTSQNPLVSPQNTQPTGQQTTYGYTWPGPGNAGNPAGSGTYNPSAWDDYDTLCGKTAVFLRLRYGQISSGNSSPSFSSGLPQVSFQVQGKNDIYIPSPSATDSSLLGAVGYTTNPALCVADFLNQGYQSNPSAWYQVLGQSGDNPVSTTAGLPTVTVASVSSGGVVTLSFSGGSNEYPPGPYPLNFSGVGHGDATGVAYVWGSFTLNGQTQYYQGGPPSGPGIVLTSSNGLYGFNNSAATAAGHPPYQISNPGTGYTTGLTIPFGNPTGVSPSNRLNRQLQTWGYGVPYGAAGIPMAPLLAAAAVCGPLSPNDTSGTWVTTPISAPAGALTEPNFSCNGEFTLDRKRSETLHEMLTSCAGRITVIEGQYTIQPGHWVTPISTPVALDGIAIGPPKWRPTVTKDALYNAIKGTYASKDNQYKETDFPYYAQDTYHGYGIGNSTLTAYNGDANWYRDGERRYLDVQYSFTTGSYEIQRLAKIELMRRRQFGTGTFLCNMQAYEYVPLDVIQANFTKLGWSSKVLEVRPMKLKFDKQQLESGQEACSLGIEMDVQETDSSVYTFSVNEYLSPQGYVQSYVPSGTVIESQCYPWSPGYTAPFAGDRFALLCAAESSPKSGGIASFGILPVYGLDAQGNGTVSISIKGTPPINALDTVIEGPQLFCTAGTSGSLPVGNYTVFISARDAGGSSYANANYEVQAQIPNVSVAANGNISVAITWGSGDDGGDLYVAAHTLAGTIVLHWQGFIGSGTNWVNITSLDQSTPGGPDTLFDHFMVVYQQEIHGGVWAAQLQSNPTTNTLTLAVPGVTLNQYTGYTLSLLAKYDPTCDVPILNLSVASNTATNGSGLVTFTIAAGGDGNTMNLTQDVPIGIGGSSQPLLEEDDLVVCRFKPTFTATSFTDPLIVNGYYPGGISSTNFEVGHVAVVLSGIDAGDVRTLTTPSSDNTFVLATPWAITPNAGDLVIVCSAQTAQFYSNPISAPNGSVVGVMANAVVQNLAGSVWFLRVVTEDVNNIYGAPLKYAPFREVYIFGTQITKELTYADSPYTQQMTDGRLLWDTTGGNCVTNLLSDAQYSGTLLVSKTSSDGNTVTINPYSGDTIGGSSSPRVLTAFGTSYLVQF